MIYLDHAILECFNTTLILEQIAVILLQDSHFVVYDLRFACRYLIRLQPVSLHRVTGEMAYVSLSTPFCWQAAVVGGIRPDCPRNGEFASRV